jgi:hypothetical protein
MSASVYYVVFNVLAISAALISFGYLLTLSILVHDTQKITDSFMYFVVEWAVVAFAPALPMLFFVLTRAMSIEKAKVWFWSLASKFAVFHLLFQLSGYYRYAFADEY